ncbi:hypothetical protein M5689_014761 [Euphorbia peplus]|nr:hypothetical protein M5689_014761 [Euphorbia peplus]
MIIVMLMSYTIVVEVEVVEATRLLLTFSQPFPHFPPKHHLPPHLQIPQLKFPKWPHMPIHTMPELLQIPNLHCPMLQLPKIPNLHSLMKQLPETLTFTKPHHLTAPAPVA